jgi:hypothetical protein
MWIIYLICVYGYRRKYLIQYLTQIPPFVGDGQRDTTGAAEAEATAAAAARGADIFNPSSLDLASVRTRGDLAEFINSASDPVAIKQEFIGPNYDNMDLDGSMDVEITGEFSGTGVWRTKTRTRTTRPC